MERLARAGFQLLAIPTANHCFLERNGFVALVEKRPDGALGAVGSPGLLADGCFAALVWNKETPVFISKGKSFPATGEQVESLRRFDEEIRAAVA